MKNREGGAALLRSCPPLASSSSSSGISGVPSAVITTTPLLFVLLLLLTVVVQCCSVPVVVAEAMLPVAAGAAGPEHAEGIIGFGEGDGDGDGRHVPHRTGKKQTRQLWQKQATSHRPISGHHHVPRAEGKQARQATPPPPPPRALRLLAPGKVGKEEEGSSKRATRRRRGVGRRVSRRLNRGRALGGRRRTTTDEWRRHRRVVVRGGGDARRRTHQKQTPMRKGPPLAEDHERRRHSDDVRDLVETFGSSSSDHEDPPEARIVGGHEVEEFRYPYLAALFKRFSPTYLEHRCGGVLVAPNVILSAAHCHDRADVAKLGEHRFDDNVTAIEEFNITQKFQHPDFDEFLLDYDVGLYVLDGVSEFAPVRMNFDELIPTDGATLHVLGWGFTRWGGKASPVPNEVGVSYQPNDSCNTRYVNSFDPAEPRITDAMMCAANPGKDACQGDSGGPLLKKGDPTYMASRRYAVDVVDDNATTTGFGGNVPAADGGNGTTSSTREDDDIEDEDVVVGLVSWGFGCADAKYPGVYARVSSVGGWIVETLCDLGHEVHCDAASAAADGEDDGNNAADGPDDAPPPAEAERAPRSTSLEP